MRSATSSTRSVMITRSLCPRISRACCASCTLIAPSSPPLALLGREHSNCTSCAQRIVDPQLEPPRNSAFGLSVRRMGSNIKEVNDMGTYKIQIKSNDAGGGSELIIQTDKAQWVLDPTDGIAMNVAPGMN